MLKTERIVVRTSEFARSKFELAASARQQSLSEFMRNSARRSARRVLGADKVEENGSNGDQED